jgi:hypothetical protein
MELELYVREVLGIRIDTFQNLILDSGVIDVSIFKKDAEALFLDF